MKIIEYRTATADSWSALDKAVNVLLAQGFQPYGNPYCSDNKAEGIANAFRVAQAMVRGGLRDVTEPQLVVAETVVAP